MRLTPRRRKLALVLLTLPPILTAAFWSASFIWLFLWAPPSTPTGQGALRCAQLHCGSLHYTARQTELAWRTANPTVEMKPIMGYSPLRQVAWPGVVAHHYPVPLRAAQWDTYHRPGNLKFPLLPAALALLIAPLTFWIITRPRRPGHCRNCDYNRAGLPITTPCPECGNPA